MVFRPAPTADRIAAQIEPDLNSGCWLWAGLACRRAGYGRMKIGGRHMRAHRVTYEMAYGKIPAGLYIDHKCRTPSCVNPAHLRAVTPRVNTLENSVSCTALNAAKTHCKRGHPLRGANVYHKRTKHGQQRICIACRRLTTPSRAKPRSACLAPGCYSLGGPKIGLCKYHGKLQRNRRRVRPGWSFT